MDHIRIDSDGTPVSDGTRASVQARLDAGDLYSRVGDFSQALATYLAVWHRAPAELQLPLSRRVAYCQSRLGRHTEVIALLEPVLGDLDDPELLSDEDRNEAGRCYNEIGNAYLVAGKLPQAQESGLTALRHFGKGRSADAGTAENILGAVAARSGEIDLARTHFRSALEHFRSVGDVTSLAFAYNNLGHVYKSGCEWDRALEHYQAAYYLVATEGEYQDQSAFNQNLAIVLMKVGRFNEALDHLERGLARALELGDSGRAFRARLNLLRWARETGEVSLARKRLTECRKHLDDAAGPRDVVLLGLEEARLDLFEGRCETIRGRIAGLRREAEMVSPTGDLVVEVLLLQAEVALVEDSLDEADVALEAVSTCDSDREQKNRTSTLQMRLLLAQGNGSEAQSLFNDQIRCSGDRGERPREARLHEHAALSARRSGDADKAFSHYETAKELYQRVGLNLLADRVEIRLIDCLVEKGRTVEAASRLETVRDRVSVSSPDLQDFVDGLAGRLESHLLRENETGIDGGRVLVRLEEIFAWDAQVSEMLRASVVLLAEALGAHGAFLAQVGVSDDAPLELLTSLSMGRLGGRRTIDATTLGIEDPRQPRVFETLVEGERAGVLAIPVRIHNRSHLLYLERREGEPRRYSKTDLDYATVLSAVVARSVPIEAPGADMAEIPEMEQIRNGLYVADIITQDPQMLSILSLVRRVAGSNLTVLLQGETGTGKKLVAQAIHRVSDRRDRAFVTVDCAALPDTLLESELFGHRKGAFTGATQDRLGLLEEANGGTIFLDEIDKAGLAVQRRFLHLLDSGEIRAVGDTGYRPLDVRVVCATSCPDLRTEVEDGKFIKDLYYRLNDIAIQIPALRDRPSDVPLLTECFIERFADEAGKNLGGVSETFHSAIRSHDWPGNVRELEKAVRRAVTLVEDGAVLSAEDLPPTVTMEDLNTSHSLVLKERLESLEKEMLLESLRRHRWNKSRAAAELGLSRKGLKGKLERYDLDRRRTRRA